MGLFYSIWLGTLDVLNKFLILPENVSKYPLIWLITKDTEDYISKTVTRKARFVIATFQRCGSIQRNAIPNRFKNILVYSNLVTLLEKRYNYYNNQEIEKEF
jgi:hypothetical protein